MRLNVPSVFMRLSLNGWPPVASHMAAVLLGVSLAHLSWHDAPLPPRLPPRAVLLTLSGATPLARGTRVHVLKAAAGAPLCRLSSEPFQLLEGRPSAVVSASYAAASDAAVIAREAHGGLQLREAAAAGGVPLCSAHPKVTYGPS